MRYVQRKGKGSGVMAPLKKCCKRFYNYKHYIRSMEEYMRERFGKINARKESHPFKFCPFCGKNLKETNE